ncbi:MAG: aminotransferase class I/II-fold pyridoxal phosphate-dependent enzyme [Myxococcota bacterium]|nr:aminotransferase class I/II-fold pyridoxal phosphate-dependent enzyme [Myxococcota bacterium]
MALNPLAEELNEAIRAQSPEAFELLSERGRALFMPKGIISQSTEASEKAHRINATIGVATEGDGPMALASITDQLGSISPADALNYAPTAGKPALRQAWRRKLVEENPAMRNRVFGLPIVTSAITHGLALVGDLFVDPGDTILLPDKLWGNYRLTYGVRLGARIETFPTYDSEGSRLNTAAFTEALLVGPEKVITLLNFPNNPTGYMPSAAEVEELRDGIVRAAERGKRVLVVVDDAYFGLVYSDDALQESPFGLLANLHPRVLTLKLCAATKEAFVWGLRCGFLTFGPPPVEDPEPLLAAFERKVMGAIRGGVSSSPAISQQLVLSALESSRFEADRSAKFETLRTRARRVGEVVRDSRFRESWDVYPFNAGYFMCIRVKGVEAEALRVHLLDKYGVGVIALGTSDIRVAFSCVEEPEIEPLFESIHEAIRELNA